MKLKPLFFLFLLILIFGYYYIKFITMSLDRAMVRYFEYMRPRQSNLTFSSSNVASSLGILHSFSKPPLQPLQKLTIHEPDATQTIPKSYSAQKSQETPIHPTTLKPTHKKSLSQLSSYGSSSLNRLPKCMNERDIYEKQEKKYNIISIQPKSYHETIKKYPKFHLEDLDQNFYKKLELQNEYINPNLEKNSRSLQTTTKLKQSHQQSQTKPIQLEKMQ